jgi:hypothetical protein
MPSGSSDESEEAAVLLERCMGMGSLQESSSRHGSLALHHRGASGSVRTAIDGSVEPSFTRSTSSPSSRSPSPRGRLEFESKTRSATARGVD